MAKRIRWTDQAKTDIRAIDKDAALQILKTLARYAKSGRGDAKQLTDIVPPLFRLRAQNHRVLFRERGGDLEILRVLDRKDAFR
jgi:plasmid stabilization system protein ParE